jgi:hypothetical protein
LVLNKETAEIGVRKFFFYFKEYQEMEKTNFFFNSIRNNSFSNGGPLEKKKYSLMKDVFKKVKEPKYLNQYKTVNTIT